MMIGASWNSFLPELAVVSLREHGKNMNKIHINGGSRLQKQFSCVSLRQMKAIQDTDSTPYKTPPQSLEHKSTYSEFNCL